MSADALVVLTTCRDPAEAQRLADGLIEARLAACVNRIDGIASSYRWQGKIARDQESLLLIKTTEARYAALADAIREQSSYALPEIIAFKVATGSEAYLAWLSNALETDAS